MQSRRTRERCEIFADYILETGCTVRSAAVYFGISKSTVHKDITVKLRYVSPSLYKEVKGILDKNKAERHLRGGEATRKKYLESEKEKGTRRPLNSVHTL